MVSLWFSYGFLKSKTQRPKKTQRKPEENQKKTKENRKKRKAPPLRLKE
jgi:hypothetical protein